MAKQTALFERRRARVRTALRKQENGRVRLSVFRSGKHIYAQLIDDAKGTTLASASTLDESLRKAGKTSTTEAAKGVGALIAERGKKANVDKVVFDRGGHIFHGRVKALADAARENGLSF